MPMPRMRSSKSSSFEGGPARTTVTASVPTSMMRPSKTCTSSMTWPRPAPSALTVTIISSRSTASAGSSSLILTTLMSLKSCLVICSRGVDSTSTTIVMRLKRSSSVGATASE